MLCYPNGNFCDCLTKDKSIVICDCAYKIGENETIAQASSWGWSLTDKTGTADVRDDGQTVYFHDGYSKGNACIRGNTPFVRGNHYFWEIKVMKPVYGSSVMIGVGTSNVDVNKYTRNFCHLLGDDEESWGLTFNGILHHKKVVSYYNSRARFSIGTIVGVHLDMWQGTLEYFINRQSMGIAFRELKDLTLYPMISSTAAHSCMRLTYSIIRQHSLYYLSQRQITLEQLKDLPYGLGKSLSECWWLFPRPCIKADSKNLEKPEPHSGIFVLIDSDEEDNEGNRVLALRMKRVLENSREASFNRSGDDAVLTLRQKMPTSKKMRTDCN